MTGRGSSRPQRPVRLRAGMLTAVFEPATGFLREVRYGATEVLRAIYGAVRDANWGTVGPRLRDLELEEGRDASRLRFTAECRAREIDFVWRGEVEVSSRDGGGRLRFRFEGEARSAFRRNRIGLCVLHPAEAAGCACTAEHPDGAATRGAFPRRIAPWQPFQDLCGFSWKPDPGLQAELRFAGEVFEMEDQRNWTDASFKTYGTPLALPFPVEVPPGTIVEQEVELRLAGAPGTDPASPPGDAPVVVRTGREVRDPLPALGLGFAEDAGPASHSELAWLRTLRPAHLRVDLDPAADPAWAQRLDRAGGEALSLGCGLEAALWLDEDAPVALDRLLEQLARRRPPIARWLVLRRGQPTTDPATARLAHERLLHYAPAAPLGVGTGAFFTELNRNPPPATAGELVFFSLNPQVHAFDDRSIVETLAMQTVVARQAAEIGGGRPVAVTPVTLRPRSNPNATGPEPEPEPGALPPGADPRQPGLLAAGWTLGSVRRLAEGGAGSVTLHATHGLRGVLWSEAGHEPPPGFPTARGRVFAVAHVLRDVAECAGGRVLRAEVSDPLAVEAAHLTAPDGGRHRLLLANLVSRPVRVRLEGAAVPPPGARRRLLDETSIERAGRDPDGFRAEAHSGDGSPGAEALLPPHAVLTFAWEEGGGG